MANVIDFDTHKYINYAIKHKRMSRTAYMTWRNQPIWLECEWFRTRGDEGIEREHCTIITIRGAGEQKSGAGSNDIKLSKSYGIRRQREVKRKKIVSLHAYSRSIFVCYEFKKIILCVRAARVDLICSPNLCMKKKISMIFIRIFNLQQQQQTTATATA